MNTPYLRMAPEVFAAALLRIHQILGTHTQAQLADKLGIRQSSISDAKRRSSIPPAWLLFLATEYGAHPEWIVRGDAAANRWVVGADEYRRPVDREALRVEIEARVRAEVDDLDVPELLARLRGRMPGCTVVMTSPGDARAQAPERERRVGQ
ncbi:MAG: helix-turn-helix domain-containing protein [Desulfovibrionaceae bacterium]